MAKQKHLRSAALTVAMAVAEKLLPHCERLEIVGSLRRGKATVGDIELLYVPRIHRMSAQTGLFGEFTDVRTLDMTDCAINRLLDNGVLKARFNVAGLHTWGPQNKLALHIASGIPLDLFATTEENWFTSLVIRTGGKDSNIALCTGAQHLGRKLNAYGCGVTMPDGSVVQATSEAHLFELCGCEYKEPEKRL